MSFPSPTRERLHMEYTLIHNHLSGNVPLVDLYDRKLVLSPFCLSSHRYFEDCRRWVEAGQYVILDNGAYEGVLTGYDEYLQLTQELRPAVVVAPDLLNVPWEESMALTEKFFADVACDPSMGATQIMIVPQGRTRDEVLKAYEYALHAFDETQVQIGLGLAYKRWGLSESDRMRMCEEINAMPRTDRFDFHLLGARRINTVNWGRLHRMRIIGCDTFKPCRMAMKGLRYLPEEPEVKVDRVNEPAVDPRALAANILGFSVEYGCRISHDNMRLLYCALEA